MSARCALSHEQLMGFLKLAAFGDAFGARFENCGPNRGDRGDRDSLLFISDDTELTLATCEALMADGEPSPEGIAKALAAAFRHKRLPGLGAATAKALKDLSLGGHWALSGAKGEKSAGAGAAMRVGALAFFLNFEEDEDRRRLRDVCRLTHHHEEAYAGALAHCLGLQSVLEHGSITLDWVIPQLPDSQTRDRLRILNKGALGAVADFAERFGASGYVADTVPLAFLGALIAEKEGFEAVLWQFADLGGDVDTQAFLAGQILGLKHGAGFLEEEQWRRVVEAGRVEETGARFFRCFFY